MKRLSGIAVMILLFAQLTGQTLNQTIQDPRTGQEVLYGSTTWGGFMNPPFAEWFKSEYKRYEPETDVLEVLDPEILGSWTVTIVMGTWCPDSRRELPRFYKIWETLDLGFNNMTIIGVDTRKNAPDDMTDSLVIERVPTFIFYRDGRELGRIVESPGESLEKELFKLLFEN